MRSLPIALFASFSLFACSAGVDTASTNEDTSDEVADQGEAALSNPNYGYFAVERDFRKCAYPMCGGYYVHRVNTSKTLCASGGYESRCYVTSIDLAKLGLTVNDLDVTHAILRGTIGKTKINNAQWGTFSALEAWSGVTDSAISGSIYRVKDNGIRCIKAPCPSTSAIKLNTNSTKNISDLDLSKTGANQEQIDAASAAIGSDEDGILVAGVITTVQGNGLKLTASEFFQKKTGIRYCGSRGVGPCNQNEFCSFPSSANCGRADAPGVCVVAPQICIQLYKPVCGCDGQTYSNSCHANAAGVSVEYAGACTN